VVDEINCQLSIIIIISFSFDLALCAYRIIKRRRKTFLSLCVKLLLLRKDEESSEWYANCVGVGVGGEKKREREGEDS
jgi:hypothetical protein